MTLDHFWPYEFGGMCTCILSDHFNVLAAG